MKNDAERFVRFVARVEHIAQYLEECDKVPQEHIARSLRETLEDKVPLVLRYDYHLTQER
jgi:hypothetical protein